MMWDEGIPAEKKETKKRATNKLAIRFIFLVLKKVRIKKIRTGGKRGEGMYLKEIFCNNNQLETFYVS